MNSSKKNQFKTQKQQAKNLIAAGDFQKAFSILTNLMGKDHKDVEVLTGLADCLSVFGQPDNALLLLDQALDINPKYILALLFKCNILGDVGKYKEGILILENEIKNGLNNCEAYGVLGELYQQGPGEYNSAIDAYKKALSFSNIIDSRTVENNLANCHAELRQFSDAMTIYDKLISDDQKDTAVLLNKAVALEEMGDSAASLKLLNQAVVIDPDFSIAWDKLAALYDNIGAHAKAKECREKGNRGIN
jgi:tetratricopeptide (TPR) repeat protein